MFLFQEQLAFGTNGAAIDAGTQAPLADWSHVAGTWSPDRVSLYVDGALVAIEPSPPTLEYQSEEILVGIDRDDGELAVGMDGRLDELRIYDRALPEDEIASLASPR